MLAEKPSSSAPAKAAPARPVMSVSRKADRPSRPAGASWVEGSGGALDRPVLSSLRSVLGQHAHGHPAVNYGSIEPSRVVHSLHGSQRILPEDRLFHKEADAPSRPHGAAEHNPAFTFTFPPHAHGEPAASVSDDATAHHTSAAALLRVRAPRMNASSVDRHQETMRRLQEENQRALATYTEHPPSERRRSSSGGQSPLVSRQQTLLTSSTTTTTTTVSTAAAGPRRAMTPEGRRVTPTVAACSTCGSPVGLDATNPPPPTREEHHLGLPAHASPLTHEAVNEDGVPSRITKAIYGPRGASPARSTKVPSLSESAYQPTMKFQEPKSVASMRTQSPQPVAPHGSSTEAPPLPVTTLVAPRPVSPYRSVPITKGTLNGSAQQQSGGSMAGLGRGSTAITSVSIRTLLPIEVTEVPMMQRSRSNSPSVVNPSSQSVAPEAVTTPTTRSVAYQRVSAAWANTSAASQRTYSQPGYVSNVGEHTSSSVVFQHQTRPDTPTRSGSAVGVETIPSSRVPKLSPPRKRTATRQGPSVVSTTNGAWGTGVAPFAKKRQSSGAPSGSLAAAASTRQGDDVASLSPSSSTSETGDGSPPKARSLSPLAVPRDGSSSRTAWVTQQSLRQQASPQQQRPTQPVATVPKVPKYCWSCGGQHPEGQAVVKFCSACGARVI